MRESPRALKSLSSCARLLVSWSMKRSSVGTDTAKAAGWAEAIVTTGPHALGGQDYRALTEGSSEERSATGRLARWPSVKPCGIPLRTLARPLIPFLNRRQFSHPQKTERPPTRRGTPAYCALPRRKPGTPTQAPRCRGGHRCLNDSPCRPEEGWFFRFLHF